MAITRRFRDTIYERIQNDAEFAITLLDEAITLFLRNEPEPARLVLRDLVNSMIGFEALAVEVNKPSKSLHRMLSARGNPTMDNLTRIFGVLQRKLNVDFEVQVVK